MFLPVGKITRMTTRQKILTSPAPARAWAKAWPAGTRRRPLARPRRARRIDRLDELADELRPAAAQVAVAELDVADTDAVPVVFGKLRDELGGLDRVIVNAGLGKGARWVPARRTPTSRRCRRI